MRLVSKNPSGRYFWVEDYNEDDKEFFIGLGFEEIPSRMPKDFGGKPTLNLKGTDMFGLWTKEVDERNTKAVIEKYGACEVWEYYPD